MKSLAHKILAQITPQKVMEEVSNIKKVELPHDLQEWVKKYEEVGKRDRFVWQLFFKTDKEADYIHRERSSRKSQQEIRFLITMFVMLVDDAADTYKNKILLRNLIEIPFTHNTTDPNSTNTANRVEKKYFEFTLNVWNRINQLIKRSPRYKELGEIFFYDIKQMIGAMEYSSLINDNPYLINKTEYWIYSPHTMQLIIGIFFDIMYLPTFDVSELRFAREIIWQALKMVRIGNCTSTWERELDDDDYTSGVFAYAVSSGVIDPNEFSRNNKFEIVTKIKNSTVESQLLREWDICYEEISKYDKKIKTINIKRLLCNLEKLLSTEIISQKYK